MSSSQDFWVQFSWRCVSNSILAFLVPVLLGLHCFGSISLFIQPNHGESGPLQWGKWTFGLLEPTWSPWKLDPSSVGVDFARGISTGEAGTTTLIPPKFKSRVMETSKGVLNLVGPKFHFCWNSFCSKTPKFRLFSVFIFFFVAEIPLKKVLPREK